VLSAIAALSGLYDIVVGAFLLFAAERLATLFGVAPASPPIFADLNAMFLLAVGAGYYLPWRDPVRYRGYLWVMGPFLKGGGALLFVTHYMLGESPRSFLLFALSDGVLAIVTLWALLRVRIQGDSGFTPAGFRFARRVSETADRPADRGQSR
jgi:hypothetical protein